MVWLHLKYIHVLVSLFQNTNTWFPGCFVGIFIRLALQAPAVGPFGDKST